MALHDEMLLDYEREAGECRKMMTDQNPAVRQRGEARLAVVEESVRQLKKVIAGGSDHLIVTSGYSEMEKARYQALIQEYGFKAIIDSTSPRIIH